MTDFSLCGALMQLKCSCNRAAAFAIVVVKKKSLLHRKKRATTNQLKEDMLLAPMAMLAKSRCAISVKLCASTYLLSRAAFTP